MEQTEQQIENLFSNTSEYDAWAKRNCQKCSKSSLFTGTGGEYNPYCDIDRVIFLAACGVAMEISMAKRMGYDGEDNWLQRNQCTEFEQRS